MKQELESSKMQLKESQEHLEQYLKLQEMPLDERREHAAKLNEMDAIRRQMSIATS